MTNTPMTSRERFEAHFEKPEWINFNTKYERYMSSASHQNVNAIDFQHKWEGWEASQAQQAQTIAELVEALKHDIGEYVKISNEQANEIVQKDNALRIAKEALQFYADVHFARHINAERVAKQALAEIERIGG